MTCAKITDPCQLGQETPLLEAVFQPFRHLLCSWAQHEFLVSSSCWSSSTPFVHSRRPR